MEIRVEKTRLSAAECAKIFDFPQEIESKTTKHGHVKRLKWAGG